MVGDQADRRKSDTYLHVIFFLLGILQTVAFAWIWKIDARSEKVPVLEQRISDVSTKIDGVAVDVKELLQRRR